MARYIDFEKLMVKTADIVNGNLWRIFPTIEVSKVKDIPKDYPGAMGVPITAMAKIGRNDGLSGLTVIGTATPRLENGKQPYKRLIIRNLKPDLPEKIDLVEWAKKCNICICFDYCSSCGAKEDEINKILTDNGFYVDFDKED